MSAYDQLLAQVIAYGVAFSAVLHHGASNTAFVGVVDAYPARLTGVQPGDLRVRVPAASLPSVLTLKSPDTVVENGTGAVFDVISAVGEFGGAGACLQLRKSQTAGAGISPPATSGATGAAGQTSYDSNYFYVCVGTNNWKRVALSSW